MTVRSKVSFPHCLVRDYMCLSVGALDTADTVWARNLKFGHSTLLMTLKKTIFFFFEILIFSRVMPLFRFSPLPTVLISNRCHSIIYRSSLSPAISWFCFWAWILILLAHCRGTEVLCLILTYYSNVLCYEMLWNVLMCIFSG